MRTATAHQELALAELEFDFGADAPVYARTLLGAKRSIVSTGVLIELGLNVAHSSDIKLTGLSFGLRPTVDSNDRIRLYASLLRDSRIEVTGGVPGAPVSRLTTFLVGRLESRRAPSRIRRSLPIRQPTAAKRRTGGTEVYARLAATGCEVRDEARVLRWIDADRSIAVAHIGSHDETIVDSQACLLHPVYVESAIITCRSVVEEDASHALVPLSIDELELIESAAAVADIEVALVSRGETWTFDMRFTSIRGTTVAEIRGLSLGTEVQALDQTTSLMTRRLQASLASLSPPTSSNDEFFAAGWSSLDLVRLRQVLMSDFGWAPALPILFANATTKKLSTVYVSRLQERASTESEMYIEDAIEPQTVPLSSSQRQIWARNAIHPNTARYHIAITASCVGGLSLHALEQSLNWLINRHAVLRTTFATDGSSQSTGSDAYCRLIEHDLTSLSDADREHAVCRLRVQADEPFDLSRAPLFRVQVIHLRPDEVELIFTFHHLIMDGWSCSLFFQELASLYDQSGHTSQPQLAAKPPGFGAFAAWEQSDERVTLWNSHLAYWREKLAFVPTLNLAYSRFEETDAGQAENADLVFDEHLVHALRQFADGSRTSLFTVFCAAYVYVLARHCGNSDVCIAMISARRSTPGVDTILGPFANTVPLRIAFGEDASFEQLVDRVRHDVLDAMEHEAYPADRFAKELGELGGLLSRAAIVYQPWSFPTKMGDLSARWNVRSLDGSSGAFANFDLELLIVDEPHAVVAQFRYAKAKLARETVTTLSRQFHEVLCSVLKTKGQRLDALVEPKQTDGLVSGPTCELADPRGRIEREFVRCAERVPEQVALVCGSSTYTYRELDERSDRLASRLRNAGVSTGARIGIYLERNVELVVAIFGVMKSGGVYVPFEPNQPWMRVHPMMVDAELALVLTSISLAGRFGADLSLLLVDSTVDVVAPRTSAADVARAAEDRLAYIMYTSGSSGRPKGVMVAHPNVLNFFGAMDDLIMSSNGGTWLALATLAFDISVLEILWTLTRGFKVVLESVKAYLSTPDVKSGSGFVQRALEARVNHLQCTPSIAQLILESSHGRKLLRELDLLLVGGEDLPLSLARELVRNVRGRVLNMYGPTEATVWCSSATISKQVSWVPIGRPIRNTTFRVLDRNGRVMPSGWVGELCVEGACVARGYWKGDSKEQERFAGAGRTRSYRTGDLVRLRASGEVEWIGRADRQLKMSGTRVELAEIERALLEMPGIAQAVVLPSSVGHGTRLVAFIVRSQSEASEVGAGEVLANLRNRLPAYMVPSRLAFVDELPLNQNGKVDISSLSRMSEDVLDLGSHRGGARTLSESLLADAWSEVLECTGFDEDTNFFELGGTSLDVLRVSTKLRERGFDVDYERLAACDPTVRAMARVLELSGASHIETDLTEEIRIDLRVRREPYSASGGALVSGGSGFLGSHLVRELIESIEGPIWCLVRAVDDRAARERLETALRNSGIGSNKYERLIVITADLEAPRLGLSDARWNELAHACGAIYHVGARVDLLSPYEPLRSANVAATRELLKLACDGRTKTFHHVSTVAVAEAFAERASQIPTEVDRLEEWRQLSSGYTRSKWAAEQLVLKAAEQGLPVCIYRVGLLIAGGHTTTPQHDGFASTLRWIVKHGSAFAAGRRSLAHLTAVDEAAKAISVLGSSRDGGARVWHVASPDTIALATLFEWIRDGSRRLEELSDDKWLDLVGKDLDSPQIAPLMRRLLLRDQLIERVDCTETLAELARHDIRFAPMTQARFDRLLELILDGEYEGVNLRTSA